MYNSVALKDVRKDQQFVYDRAIQVVVKIEENIFGNYDIWYKRADDPSLIPNGHIELPPDRALLCRN